MGIQTRYIYVLRYLLPVVDVLLLNIVYFISANITLEMGKKLNYEVNNPHVIICNLIWLLSTAFFGLYTAYSSRKIERIYRSTWRSAALHFVFFNAYIVFFNQDSYSRTFLVIFYFSFATVLIVSRFFATAVQYIVLNKFNAAKKVAILGANGTALKLSNYFSGQHSVSLYGFLGDDELIYDTPDDTNLPAISLKLSEAVEQGVKEVYVIVAPQRFSEISGLVAEADRQCIRLKFIPDFGHRVNTPFHMSYLGGEFPIITLRYEPLEIVGNRFKKRFFDILFSSLVIVFILSWLYPLIALLIKLDSRGPVLFKQLRSGRNDESFWCYKFRSMTINAESNDKQATRNDPRVTSIGRFLRKSSLDEMPQFFNVFFGEMSVVGPRPHMLKHTNEYKEIIKGFMVRHFLKPGITGWAQVNGFRGETRLRKDMEDRVKCDIYYLENWTAMLDVKIIFMTIINMIRGEKNAV